MATPYQWYADNRLAELRMLQGLASSAQTNGSPQVRALMEMMARNVFGAEGLDSMALSDLQLMQYITGVGIDNGIVPYVDDGAQSFERMYQMVKATGQFRGMDMEDRGALTYALHQRMQSAIYAPDGSTNYTFTGGLDGGMASQLYTALMRRELASGRSRLSGTNVNIAQGATYADRVQSMLSNAERLQATGEMTSSELMRYQSAARSANRELGTETAVQAMLLREGLKEGGNMLELSDADRALQEKYGVAGLLQSENVLNQLAKRYDDVKDKEAFNRSAVEAYAASREDSIDIAVMRQAVYDSRQGKKTRLLGVDAIQDASIGEVLLGAGSGDLAVTRLGATARRNIERKEGESIEDFIKRVVQDASMYNDRNGGGTTSDSLAALQTLSGTYGRLAEGIRERKGADYAVTDADIREEIAKAYGGKDGYKDVDRSFIEGVSNLEKLLDEGRAETDVMQNGLPGIDEKVKDLFDKYGRTIRSLQDIFGTDNLNELQRNVNEMHWGSLTNDKDLQRISANMESVFGIAQVSGRSVQSVMLERKALTKALSAMSGGDSFVSDGEIAMMQMAMQEVDRASQSGAGSISKEEALAKMKRSVDNALALENFGGAAAAKSLLESNRDLFSDKDAAYIEGKVRYIESVLSDPNSTMADRDNARYEARMLSERLTEYGITPLAQRRAAAKQGAEFGSISAYNGLVTRFDELIADLGPDGDKVFATAEQRSAAKKIFALSLKAFGNTDPGRFNEFKTAVENGRLDSFLESHPELAGSEADLREVASLIKGMSTQQLGHISRQLTDQSGGLINGAQAVQQHRIANWEAFVQASTDTSLGVRSNRADGLLGGFIRGLLNGNEAPLTAEQALQNDMWDQIFGPNRQAYGGGRTLESRADALRDVLATERGRKRFGENAAVLGVYDKDKVISDNDAYARALRGIGYTDEEVAAELEEFKASKTAADRGTRMRDMFGRKGYQLVIADGVVTVMNEAAARAAAVSDERSWKELSQLDFSEALKEDGVVSKEELLDILGKDNFDKDGVYTGPLEALRGKTIDKLLDAGTKGSFNYKGNDGDRTLAQLIDDKRNGNGAVDTIATEVGAWTGQFKSIYDLLKEWRNESRQDRAGEAAAENVSNLNAAAANNGFGDTSWLTQDVHDHVTPSAEQGTSLISQMATPMGGPLDNMAVDVHTILTTIQGPLTDGLRNNAAVTLTGPVPLISQ